jgi:signal transduction histidine kinase
MRVRAVRGMVIQIFQNLIANSVYWLKQQKKYEADFKPRINIDIDPDTQSIVVEDNGPGVDPRRGEAIFQPFVTSKPPRPGEGTRPLHSPRTCAVPWLAVLFGCRDWANASGTSEHVRA